MILGERMIIMMTTGNEEWIHNVIMYGVHINDSIVRIVMTVIYEYCLNFQEPVITTSKPKQITTEYP